ncbi:MAG TPA: hypothetical protein VKT30_00005, partial [Caulobacteraceae bacterium]|nr:hypothetical protein [Caulobacteraceae bacterium]
MHTCDSHAAPEVVIEIQLQGSNQAALSWTFAKASGDPDIGVDTSPNGGDLDFHTKNQPVWVQMTLKPRDPAVIFFRTQQVDVFGFMHVDEGRNYNANDIVPVGANDSEFQHIQLSADMKTVTFCYMNKEHNPFSRYAIYLGDATHPPAWSQMWIDPRITNGQFSGGP